jgi:hypothetical protein
MFKGRKKKRKIFGVTKSGKAKPIKALTGLEVALISVCTYRRCSNGICS